MAGARPYPVVRVASVPLPRYRCFRLGVPSARLTDALIWHAADMLHLASPFLIGARAAALARQLRVPSVAVYQTEVAAYLRHYRGLGWGEATVWKWLRTIHNGVDRTLAPSNTAAADLNAHGIRNVWLWGGGVDATRFHPSKRNSAVRRALAPNGETLVGYVGRVAAEKRLDLLGATSRLRGVRLVVIGDGPARREAERALPQAVFLGFRGGEHLARLFASLDVFVHAGPHETFCQSIQEAQASGVSVVGSWAAEEFRRIGAPNLVQVPLGVDLTTFHPAQRDEGMRDRYAGRDEVLLVHCSRLSSEKRSDLAVAALAALRAGGMPAVLVVIGDGPQRSALERRSAGLPVCFTGFLPHRESVAKLLASADVAVQPGPVETFGLAALEALACGTPAVVNAASALPEVVGDVGATAAGTGPGLSAAVRQLLSRDPAQRRADARARAEGFGWPASVDGFLRAHGV